MPSDARRADVIIVRTAGDGDRDAVITGRRVQCRHTAAGITKHQDIASVHVG